MISDIRQEVKALRLQVRNLEALLLGVVETLRRSDREEHIPKILAVIESELIGSNE